MKQIVYTACLCILIITAISNKRRRYEDYKSKCETLLDSIAAWDDSFLDTVCETETYQDYIESREKLNN